ncbi:PepSY-associated TM helix domain-containing protein [Paenibacillus sp. y28]|uniref:PepSY-associated TM helix domain-containing protein n=1 Tax=Paenibacillus sp. y28 TaxID=3129110 RepID=UPI00301AFF1F
MPRHNEARSYSGGRPPNWNRQGSRKTMKKTRQLHLWIGLVTSIFILMQAVTGLLMSEPWLIGMSGGEGGRPAMTAGTNAGAAQGFGQQPAGSASGAQSADTSAAQPSAATANTSTDAQGTAGGRTVMQQPGQGPDQGGSSSAMRIIKGLHEGKIGGTNIKWLIDLTAVGMMILTVTGISLSIKALRAQAKGRRKRAELAR